MRRWHRFDRLDADLANTLTVHQVTVPVSIAIRTSPEWVIASEDAAVYGSKKGSLTLFGSGCFRTGAGCFLTDSQAFDEGAADGRCFDATPGTAL